MTFCPLVVDDNLFGANEFNFYMCFSFFLVIRTKISEHIVQIAKISHFDMKIMWLDEYS